MLQRLSLGLALALATLVAGGSGVWGESSTGERAEVEVNVAYGIAAFNRGADRDAVDLLSAALRADPEHALARYYLALAHLRLGDAEAAIRELEALRAAPDSSIQDSGIEKAEVEARLAEARRVAAGEPPGAVIVAPAGGEVVVLSRPPRYDGRLGLGLGWDDNPGLIPDGLEARLPDGRRFAGPESDSFADLDLRFEVHPFYGRRGFSLGLAVAGRQALFDELDFADLGRAQAVANLAWGGDPLGLLAGPLGYTRVPRGLGRIAWLAQAGGSYDWLDGEPFVRRQQLALAVTVREGRATATQAEIAWTDEHHFGAGGRQESGERASVALSQFLYLGRRDRYLRLGARAEERDAGDAFDSSLLEGRAELALPLAPRFAFHFAGSVGRLEFDELASNPYFPLFIAEEPRRDDLTRVTAALVWEAAEGLLLTARGTFLERDSDLGPAADLVQVGFDRTVVALGIAWFFGGGERGGSP